MYYFFLIAIVVTLLTKRSPLKSFDNVKLRFPYLFIGAFILQVILFVLFELNTVRFAYLFELTLAIIILGLWINRQIRGMKWILVGCFLNLAAIIIHSGRMPVIKSALDIARISYTPEDARHQLLIDSAYWWLGDWIPLYKKVLSIGDFCVGIGIIIFFLHNSPLRRANETSK